MIKDDDIKDDYINNLTSAEFTYAIVEMLKKNKNIPDEYLYGSIFLKAIIESYNNHKYRKVIELGKLAKDSLAFRKSTEEVKDLIIFYYCSALAREKDDEF